ncbi:PAS domain S-box protein [Geothrix sp. 21YS21S-2]|uniref:PAS domain S-box protein n=1 Tax=Geothrix sp. 21YS21S-2 TaxID=3068893 RepID=UPI0027B90160|nr:PAS domain S-box protein [Geothrix sp. 21YS21S-2]
MFDTGAHLRKVRKKYNLTLDQLAGRSGIDRGTISRIELGHVSPRIDTIDCLCRAMNTTLPEFFGHGDLWTGAPDAAPQAGPVRDFRAGAETSNPEADLYWPVPKAMWQSLVDVVERFEALLAHSSELVLVLDSQGRIIYLSPGGENLLGHKRAEVLGLSVLDIIHADDRLRFQAALLGEGPGSATSRNFRLRHRNGEWLAFECTLTDHLKSPSIRAKIVNAALA